MITSYIKIKKSIKNLFFRFLPATLLSIEGEIPNNLDTSLEANTYNEYSDEEWLIAKHRMLDSRIEFRNLMKTI